MKEGGGGEGGNTWIEGLEICKRVKFVTCTIQYVSQLGTCIYTQAEILAFSQIGVRRTG